MGRLILRIGLHDHDAAIPLQRDKGALERGEGRVVRRRRRDIRVVARAGSVVEIDAADLGVVTRVDRVFLLVEGREKPLQIRLQY